MTGNRFIVDTNIVSDWVNGESKATELFEKASFIGIPIIVFGELCHGVINSTLFAKNVKDIQTILDKYFIIPIDEATAAKYGKIRTQLQKKGKTIPENDTWIASTSIHFNIPLVSRDKHFTYVDGLQLIKW